MTPIYFLPASRPEPGNLPEARNNGTASLGHLFADFFAQGQETSEHILDGSGAEPLLDMDQLPKAASGPTLLSFTSTSAIAIAATDEITVPLHDSRVVSNEEIETYPEVRSLEIQSEASVLSADAKHMTSDDAQLVRVSPPPGPAANILTATPGLATEDGPALPPTNPSPRKAISPLEQGAAIHSEIIARHHIPASDRDGLTAAPGPSRMSNSPLDGGTNTSILQAQQTQYSNAPIALTRAEQGELVARNPTAKPNIWDSGNRDSHAAPVVQQHRAADQKGLPNLPTMPALGEAKTSTTQVTAYHPASIEASLPSTNRAEAPPIMSDDPSLRYERANPEQKVIQATQVTAQKVLMQAENTATAAAPVPEQAEQGLTASGPTDDAQNPNSIDYPPTRITDLPGEQHRYIPTASASDTPKILPANAAAFMNAEKMMSETAEIEASYDEATDGDVRSSDRLEIRVHSPAARPSELARAHIAQQVQKIIADSIPSLSTENAIEITLQPEELGRLKMVLQPGESSMAVAISVERPETLEIIRRHIEELSAQLKELGYLKLDLSLMHQNNRFGAAEQETEQNKDPVSTIAIGDQPVVDQHKTAMRLTSAGVDIRI